MFHKNIASLLRTFFSYREFWTVRTSTHKSSTIIRRNIRLQSTQKKAICQAVYMYTERFTRTPKRHRHKAKQSTAKRRLHGQPNASTHRSRAGAQVRTQRGYNQTVRYKYRTHTSQRQQFTTSGLKGTPAHSFGQTGRDNPPPCGGRAT